MPRRTTLHQAAVVGLFSRLRAAAQDTVARRTVDVGLAVDAGADLANARRLAPELALDPRWFSPACRARWAAALGGD